MALRQREERAHIGRDAAVVQNRNGFRARRHGRFDRRGLDCCGRRININEHAPRAPERNCRGGRRKSETRQNHLVAGLDAEKKGRHFESVRARRGHENAIRARDGPQSRRRARGHGAVTVHVVGFENPIEARQFAIRAIRSAEYHFGNGHHWSMAVSAR